MTDAVTSLEHTVDLLYPELNRELDKIRRMLERFPDAHAAWTPHPKSRTLASLATHLASLGIGARLLDADEVDVATRTPPALRSTAAELMALFDDGANALKAALPRATPDALRQPWTLRVGPRVLFSQPRHVVIREMLINHFIHHRAQLGVYYRLLDVPVPGTYGPSADEPIV